MYIDLQELFKRSLRSASIPRTVLQLPAPSLDHPTFPERVAPKRPKMRESGVASSGEKTALCTTTVRGAPYATAAYRCRSFGRGRLERTSPRRRKGEENIFRKKNEEAQQRLQKSRCERSCNRPACATSNFVHPSKRIISPRKSINYKMLKTAF